MTRGEQVGHDDCRQGLGSHLHQCACQGGRCGGAGLGGDGEVTGDTQAHRCKADPRAVFTEAQRRDDGAGADGAEGFFTESTLPAKNQIEHRHRLRDVIRLDHGAGERLARTG